MNVFLPFQVFLSVALYNNIRLVMTFFFPFGITQAAESLISVKRLQVILDVCLHLHYGLMTHSNVTKYPMIRNITK